MLMDLYFGFICSLFSIFSKGLYKYIRAEENRIKEQIAINGGIKKLKNLTFLFNPNLNFLGMLEVISVFFILTFGDSFN